MKEYVFKGDLSEKVQGRVIFTHEIDELPTVTKVDICKEFYEKLMKALDYDYVVTRQEIINQAVLIFKEMNNETFKEYDTREYAKQNPEWVEKIKRLAETEDSKNEN